MRIFKALSHRTIQRLWLGQVFSGIGDEVYMIALIWFATQLIGTDAGYVASLQAGSIFLFSLIGGVWADHRDNRRIMIISDLVRGIAVLILPLSTFFVPLSLWLLLPVAIVVSSLSAFFAPALKAFLPTMIEDQPLLETTNALMETTNRFARVLGPGFIGALSRLVPVVHYFSLDALSFFISAWSISTIPRATQIETPHERSSLMATLSAGYRLCCKDPLVMYLMVAGAFASAAWLFVYPLGITLYLKEKITGDVGALGWAIFGYGIGNITSNLILSNMTIRFPARLIFIGELFGGFGFIVFALSQNLIQAMCACAITAIGGPMTDLGLITLLQRKFRGRDLVRIHRFNMATGYGLLLIVLLLSPFIFHFVSVPHAIIISALFIAGPGMIGMSFFKNR
jgi:MFS family permease